MIILLLANLLLLVWLLVRKPADSGRTELLAGMAAGHDRLERELRREITDSARNGRQELASTFATFQQTLVQQSAEAIRTQNTQIDAFAQHGSSGSPVFDGHAHVIGVVYGGPTGAGGRIVYAVPSDKIVALMDAR